MKTILFLFGTRPEAIKLAPLYLNFKNSSFFNVKVCVTAQHRQMLDQVLKFFSIKPDYDLDLMKPNQSLFSITSDILKEIEPILNDFNPDYIFLQGDTTTAFCGALAAFYKKIKVAHIEAGLRSKDKYSPFPEEMNRILVGHLSDYHFAPTQKARENLIQEGLKDNIWVVGNTVIDALFLGLKIIDENPDLRSCIEKYFYSDIQINNSNIVLITGHRRESFGTGFENICNAIKELALSFKDFSFIYPVHLNPNVQEPVYRILNGLKNVHLIPPLEYHYLIWLMKHSYLVLTDSGGIQEEAPSLGKPVLVMRNVTERTEGIEAGTAKLVGTSKETIVKEVANLIEDKNSYDKMSKAVNPYGDGKTCERIIEIFKSLN